MKGLEFDSQRLAAIKELTAQATSIAIIAHRNADGDAMGSLLGMYHILSDLNPKAKITPLLPNGCPKQFTWMPHSELILNGDTQLEACNKALMESELIIGVDFNVPSRVDFLETALVTSPAKKILIDHHHNPDKEHFDVVISRSELSSACELVYWVAQAIWGDSTINQDAARSLYTGICTDTGSFSYSCEQPSLYEAAAALVAKDINAADIHNHINNTFSIERMQFFGFAISERLHIYEKEKFAYFSFSLQDQQEHHISAADMEGLVNYTLMMEQIEVGVLIREEATRTKISFRSKKDVDVNNIARTHFGGGGHTKAAGADSPYSFEETIQRVKELFIGD